MIAAGNQRWRERKSIMRPDDPIDTSQYEVVASSSDTIAKAFVQQHHYAATLPAARERLLMYHRPTAELVGCAVFSHPASEDVLAKLPCERLAGVELGRFVLLDNVPGNGETWFLGRCFDHLRTVGIECLLSHSDPVPRRTAAGELVMPGHVGRIYQATNAVYAGRARAQQLNLLPDGTSFSERSMSKIRCAERGWERDCMILVKHGAEAPFGLVAGGTRGDRKLGIPDDPRWVARRDWLWRAIGQVCRRIDHAGNHRYLWAIDRSLRKTIAAMAVRDAGAEIARTPNGSYPKLVDADQVALPLAA